MHEYLEKLLEFNGGLSFRATSSPLAEERVYATAIRAALSALAHCCDVSTVQPYWTGQDRTFDIQMN